MPAPRKSNHLHALHGSKPHDRKSDAPSLFHGGRPKFPAHLSKAARTEMKRVIRILEERGTATEGDFALLALYGEVFARWIAAKAQMGADLMVTTTLLDSNGVARTVTRVNPLLKIVQASETKIHALVKELGLTPTMRDKVKPTAGGNAKDEVIPGSMLDLYPELYSNAQKEEVKNVS